MYPDGPLRGRTGGEAAQGHVAPARLLCDGAQNEKGPGHDPGPAQKGRRAVARLQIEPLHESVRRSTNWEIDEDNYVQILFKATPHNSGA